MIQPVQCEYDFRSKRGDGQPTPLGFWLVEEDKQSAVNGKSIISEPSHSDWWNDRFMSEEALEMSELGRMLFVYEVRFYSPLRVYISLRNISEQNRRPWHKKNRR